jgi:excisionase family DNA binding protein
LIYGASLFTIKVNHTGWPFLFHTERSTEKMQQKELEIPLTTKQAAQALGIKPGTLEIWRVRGDGPAFMKIGRAVRYRRDDIEAFMTAGRRASTSEGA